MPLVKLPRGTLLVFTDGLTDSISGKNPESRLSDALADTPGRTMSNLKSLVDPKLNADDVTILLVKIEASEAFVGFVSQKTPFLRPSAKDLRLQRDLAHETRVVVRALPSLPRSRYGRSFHFSYSRV